MTKTGTHLRTIDRMADVMPDAGTAEGVLDHLETAHGYRFGPDDDPLLAPYALGRLHRDLHARGSRHEMGG